MDGYYKKEITESPRIAKENKNTQLERNATKHDKASGEALINLSRFDGNQHDNKVDKREATDAIGNDLANPKLTDQAVGYKSFDTPIADRNEKNEKVFHANEIKQGALGDCYFHASLGAIAYRHPEAIKNAIQDNQDKTYTVTFYDKQPNGRFEKTTETVDSSLPVDKNGRLVYAEQGNNGALWPAIYEKAWAQKNNGYDVIDRGGHPGPTLENLTGKPSTYEDPRYMTVNTIGMHLDAGHAIVFTTPEQGKMSLDLVPNHSYYVEKVDRNTNTVTLRNPWGDAFPPAVIRGDQIKNYFDGIVINPVK